MICPLHCVRRNSSEPGILRLLLELPTKQDLPIACNMLRDTTSEACDHREFHWMRSPQSIQGQLPEDG